MLEKKLREYVAEPFAAGIATFLVMQVVLLILDAVGFTPFIGAGSTFSTSIQGIVGLLGFFWVLGMTVSRIPKLVSGLLEAL